MAYFEWNRELIVGHRKIDEQHKRLLLLAEAALEPLIDSAEHQPRTAQLQALIDFAQEHFAFEEGLMRSVDYPEAKQHAKQHASLLTELRTYCDKEQCREITNPVGMVSFLWNWLVRHINSADRDMVIWIRSSDPDFRLPVINSLPVG